MGIHSGKWLYVKNEASVFEGFLFSLYCVSKKLANQLEVLGSSANKSEIKFWITGKSANLTEILV